MYMCMLLSLECQNSCPSGNCVTFCWDGGIECICTNVCFQVIPIVSRYFPMTFDIAQHYVSVSLMSCEVELTYIVCL